MSFLEKLFTKTKVPEEIKNKNVAHDFESFKTDLVQLSESLDTTVKEIDQIDQELNMLANDSVLGKDIDFTKKEELEQKKKNLEDKKFILNEQIISTQN